MAISQVGKGVFLVKPDKFKRYQDTAAGKYTSIFTKSRMDQWELSLKEAERQAGVKEFEYKARMELYRDRLRQQERELADLQKLRIQVLNGEVKAEDAAIALGVKVEQGNVKEQNRRDELVAQRGAVVVGETKTESGGGGRGRAPDPTAVSTANKAELGLAKDQAAPSDPAALAAQVRTRLDDKRFVTTTEVEADAIRHAAVEEMVQDKTARLMAEDPTSTYDKARGIAAGQVEEALSMGNRDMFDAFERVEGKVDAADAAAGTPRKTTSTRRAQFYDKYKNLDTDARRALEGGVESIPAVPISSREDVLKAITDAEAVIRGRTISEPTISREDLITEARRIAAGRFGPLSPQPAAFEERNALQRLLNMSDEEFAKAREEAGQTTPAKAPITPPTAPPSGTEAEPRGTEVIPPEPEQPRIAPEPTEPAQPRIEPEPAAAPPPAPPPEPAPSPAPEIRPEAAALMTPAERADFKRRLEERAALGQLMREQKAEMADVTGPSEAYRAAALTQMSPPAELPRPQRPQMEAPRSVAERMVMPSISIPPPPSIGSYTPGPVPPAGPRPGPPSTEGAAPKGPAEAPPGYLQRKATGQIPSVPVSPLLEKRVAADAKKDIGILQTETPYRPTVGRYFNARAEVADKLADQPDKIKRLTASGPGRIASDIYKANKAKGIEFKTTWQEIQMTFADDRASMERAHEIALALDMMDEDAKQPKE